MTDKEFVMEFNEYYPFERYILKTPKKIDTYFDDVVLTELFIPSTEIRPNIIDGHCYGYTKINDEEIYLKLKTNVGEFRIGYYNFDDCVRENIRNIIINDFGRLEWECLYVEYEEQDDLKKALSIQIDLIKEKYGHCNMKKNFIIEDTINILKEI